MPDIDEPWDGDEDLPPEMTPIEQLCEAIANAAGQLGVSQELKELARSIRTIRDDLRELIRVPEVKSPVRRIVDATTPQVSLPLKQFNEVIQPDVLDAELIPPLTFGRMALGRH